MSYPTNIEDIEGKAKVTLATVVGRGDILGYSSGWKLADADAVIEGTCTDGTGTCTGSPVALAMGANVVAVEAVGTFTVLLAPGTTGEVVGDGTCLVTGEPKALASGSNTITTTGAAGDITITLATGTANVFAQYIALQSGKSGDSIAVCRKCTFFDEDKPYVADTPYYLSGTAGTITATRPATDGDLIQVIGRGIDSSRVRVEIEPPKEFELFISPDSYDTTGEAGLGAPDAGWVGPQVDAAGEVVYFKGRLPSGLVGSIALAKVVLNSIGASGADLDFSIVGAYDGASNVQDTGTAITATDWEQADTDNILYTVDVSALFDADFYKPGRNFCVLSDPDGITGDVTVIGLAIRGWKV